MIALGATASGGTPTPTRIVSMTPSITSQLYELHADSRVVGITAFCPRANERQVVVGTYLQPNIERIVSLAPDLVLVSKEGTSPEIAPILEKFGVPLRAVDPVNSWEDLVALARTLADTVGARERCVQLEREAVAAVRSIPAGARSPVVLALVALDPLVAASSTSYIGAVIAAAGGRAALTTGVRYPVLSPEEVARLNPDIILITGGSETKADVERFRRRFRHVRAVRRGAVYPVDPDVLCQPTLGNWRRGVTIVAEVLQR